MYIYEKQCMKTLQRLFLLTIILTIQKIECSQNAKKILEKSSSRKILFDESCNVTLYFSTDPDYCNTQKEYIQYLSANITHNFQDLSIEEKQIHKKKQQRIAILKMKSPEAKVKWIRDKIKTKTTVIKTQK